jgi:hypothetical protein
MGRTKGGTTRPRPGLTSTCRYVPAKLLAFCLTAITQSMTEQEARQAINEIRGGINSIRARIYDLDRRKGWKALGYRSFTACCMAEFPELHERTIRRQLYVAQIEDTLKKELGPDGPKSLGSIPEAHLRPLVSVKNDDETLVAAFDKAQEIAKNENEGRLTEAIVRRAVEETKSSPRAGDLAWSQNELNRKEQVLAGKTVVANMHKDTDLALIAWAKETGRFIPIDRRSDWGNPFVMGDDGDRDTVCNSYELFFQLKLSLHIRIKELQGAVLGCWCYPNRCHGEYLVQQLEQTDA